MKRLWLILSMVTLVVIGAACVESLRGVTHTDFAMFWLGDQIPYPPPYLFFVKPFAPLPYGLAFSLWIVLTGALYFVAAPSPKRTAFANPAAAFNGMIGQNGFLTSAIFFAGLRDLARNPERAGAILGMLVIKPHLALALPIAVIGGRHWRAVPTAVATMAALLVGALLVFGTASYAHFLEDAGFYSQLLDKGGWGWDEVASVFGLARWAGAGVAAGMALQFAAAFAAAVAVWLAWRRNIEGKVALTAAATLLISPYLFTYDAVLLTAALAWLRGPKAMVVWLLLAFPLLRVFVHLDWPNTVPLAAAFAVGSILAERPRLEATMA